MRAAILTLLLCVACQLGPTYERGNDADQAVKRALSGLPDGAAALSTGRMLYVLPQGALVKERRKLVEALAAAEVIPLEFNGFQDVTVVSRAESRVMAFARPQVFEADAAEGTLHVERVAMPGAATMYYAVSLIGHRRVSTSQLRVSARLEGAWRALFDATRAAGKIDARLGGLPASADRPLDAMRDIGVDLRGIEPR